VIEGGIGYMTICGGGNGEGGGGAGAGCVDFFEAMSRATAAIPAIAKTTGMCTLFH
jgi:hypothetical protein